MNSEKVKNLDFLVFYSVRIEINKTRALKCTVIRWFGIFFLSQYDTFYALCGACWNSSCSQFDATTWFSNKMFQKWFKFEWFYPMLICASNRTKWSNDKLPEIPFGFSFYLICQKSIEWMFHSDLKIVIKMFSNFFQQFLKFFRVWTWYFNLDLIGEKISPCQIFWSPSVRIRT